jgi:ferredoxin
MVAVDLEKCVGCGCCQVVCPREAPHAWAYARIHTDRCTDCYDGIHRFEEDAPPEDRKELLDRNVTIWQRACIENCPVGALSVDAAEL